MSDAPVFVRGIGVVTPAGVGVEALRRALADPEWHAVLGLERPDASPLPVAVCHAFEPRQHIPPMVLRRLDRPARLLMVAAREAMTAESAPLPWDRNRIGVCAGTWNAGTEPLVEVLRAVFLASPDEAPPMQFPSTVANAPASQLAILEALGGPNLTFAEKQVGGVRAIAEAATLLRHGRADAALAGGVDEAQWLNAEGYSRLGALRTPGRAGMVLAEGAAVVLLATDPGRHPVAAIAGSGSASSIAPPHLYPEDAAGLLTACRHALRHARVEPGDVDALISVSNGLPVLSSLEARALGELFGAHRPAAVAVAERIGESAFTGTLRVVVAALTVGGRLRTAWPAPSHLAELGFPALTRPPRTVLVPALAGGGAAIALVITVPD